jgi:serine/threonine-protein kinase
VDSPGNKQSGEITRIGKYEIVDELGRGGMGVVYRGIDKQIGREVAIKTLTQGFLGDSGMLARFYEEGRRTGRLKHPNIVTVYDLGDHNGTPYIVMECVEGDPLDKLIRSESQLSLADQLGIIEEVCSALGYAHRNNVIHRDVKPANIFVQPDGSAKLLDFGIARLEKRDQNMSLTQTGYLIGTVPYMAPERLRNEIVDGRSDIFAAGVVLYELVAGQPPFSGADTVLMSKILTEPHPRLTGIRPDLPASLDPIIDRAMAKSPDDRYSTAEEMAADLMAVIAELRQEQVQELIPEARRLMQAGEFTRARGVLHQLLKIDSKHAEARTLLGEIQQHFTQRQREERIQQICLQAEDDLSHNRFDQSLAVLESGLELDASNPALVKLREKARSEKDKQDRVKEFLHQAETARRKGDFKSAIEAARKALDVDRTNPRLVALNNILTQEAEEAQRKAQSKILLDSARGRIASRQYSEAIELLSQVEKVDPTNPEIPLLLGDANAGLEQGRRKEVVAKLEEEFAQATGYEQLQQTARSIQEAMAAMPSESGLFRLNAMVERQIKEYENRFLVDETIQACRNLRPREAMELVQKARLRLPGEERLLSLETLLAERLKQQTVEEHRTEALARAREAMQTGQHSDAVRILEACRSEGIVTDEVLSLLDFARTEELEQQRQELLRSKLAQAQALISDAAYDEAIEFLKQALQQHDDAALRMLLNQASAGRDSLRAEIEAVLASAISLIQAGKQDEAVEFLKKQPQAIQRSGNVRTSLAALEEERTQALFRTLGRAYAGLETDLSAGQAAMRRAVTASDQSPIFVPVAEAFRARGQALADRSIAEATRNAKSLLRERNREAAELALKTVSGIVDFASSKVRSEWQDTQRNAAQTSLIARLRG